MRVRIQEAAAQLGYCVPVVGRKTGKSKTRTVGVVIDVLQNNPFMTQLLEHLHVALHKAGYQVMLFMDSQIQRSNVSSARPLIDDYLEGMIFATATLGAKIVLDLHDRGMPIVLVVRSIGSDKIDTVEIDNVHAGAEAARHLHELGHREIGLVMGPQNTSTSRDRAEGALNYLVASRSKPWLGWRPKGWWSACSCGDRRSRCEIFFPYIWSAVAARAGHARVPFDGSRGC